MGTNFYLRERGTKTDDLDAALHIGKSSQGWCFALHVIPEEGLFDLPDWERKFRDPKYEIIDEYRKPVSVDEMIFWITQRSFPRPWDPADLARNSAVAGPNNLARHTYCATPGAGTWDCCRGEFS